jgi:transcriptional regulator with XRE-family HTH domain
LSHAIAARLRAAMAGHTPVIYQRDIEAQTGIEQSTVSRLLKPTKQMTLEQLEAICGVVGLDAIEVMSTAQKTVKEQAKARGRTWRDDLADDIRRALDRSGMSHNGIDHVAGTTVIRARKGDPTVDESTLTLITRALGLDPVQVYKDRYVDKGAVEQTAAPGAREADAS